MVGSFDSVRIVFHALGLLCVDVMTSFHLFFFSSVILSISLFPDYMVPRQKGCLNSCFCMLHIDFFIGAGTYSVRHHLGMRLIDASHKFVSYMCSDKKKLYCLLFV